MPKQGPDAEENEARQFLQRKKEIRLKQEKDKMLEMEQQLKEEKQKKMNRVNDSLKVTYDIEGKLLKVKPVNGNNLKQLDADKDILGYNLI